MQLNNIEIQIDKNSKPVFRKDFIIPEDWDELYIEIDYPTEFSYNSFIIIYDEKKEIRLQKLLGYGCQKIGIGKDGEHTSAGAVAGDIVSGKWEIVVGTFGEYLQKYRGVFPIDLVIKISSEQKEIIDAMDGGIWTREGLNLEISKDFYDWKKVYSSERGWYRGDLHTHTRVSDGKETLENAMRKAENMKLDFYAPTEHNLVHTGWVKTDVMPIPGVEITTDLGHFNLIGIDKEPSQIMNIMQFMKTKSLSTFIERQIREAVERKWIVSINHPFLEEWSWKYKDLALEDITCIEIINDPTYSEAEESNESAIEFLDRLWMDGHKIYGVGGSDSHNLITENYSGTVEHSVPGDPATNVFCEKLTPENLVNGIKSGHICVSRYCNMKVTANDGNKIYYPGDCIEIDDSENIIDCFIEIENCMRKPFVKLLIGSECGIVYKNVRLYSETEGKYEGRIKVKMSAEIWQFVRFEIRDFMGNFMGYSNPIYSGEKLSRYKKFSEIL